MGPSTELFDVGGQRLVTPPIRGRAGELKVIGGPSKGATLEVILPLAPHGC